VTLLNDGANPPEHLPGADPATLAVLTGAYLTRLREHIEIDDDLLARWQAVSAVGRIAEGWRGAAAGRVVALSVGRRRHAAAN